MGQMANYAASAGDRLCYNFAKPPVKEACAEFLATFVLVVLGDGVMASCVLGRLNLNSVLAEAFGWGFAVMIAVAVSGGVSGGHINPAVTVSLASVKKCPWKHVAPYVVAQYLGGFLAAAVVYLTYMDAINMYDGGVRQIPPSANATAQIFATYSQSFASLATCFLDQVLGTALLLILICAATDMKNLRVPPHSLPMIIGVGVTGILLAFGHNCGAPLNPARDFAPRLFTGICGWGAGVFNYRNYEWFWVPIIAPHVGGIIGVWLYKVLIELPFENYSRLLQETESPDFTDEDRRRLSGLDIKLPSPPLERSVSPEDSAYKRALEKVADRSAKLVPNSSSSGQQEDQLDFINAV